MLASTARTKRLRAETAVLMYLLLRGQHNHPRNSPGRSYTVFITFEYFQVICLNRSVIYLKRKNNLAISQFGDLFRVWLGYWWYLLILKEVPKLFEMGIFSVCTQANLSSHVTTTSSCQPAYFTSLWSDHAAITAGWEHGMGSPTHSLLILPETFSHWLIQW